MSNHWVVIDFLSAIERHGLLQRFTEYSRPPSDGWERTRCHRVYPQRRGFVSPLLENILDEER